MNGSWTFGQRLGVGFGTVVFIAFAMCVAAVLALNAVVDAHDALLDDQATNMIEASRLQFASEHRVSAIRAFLLTKDATYLDNAEERRAHFETRLTALFERNPDSGTLTDIKAAQAEYDREVQKLIDLVDQGASPEAVAIRFATNLQPARDRLNDKLDLYVSQQQESLNRARSESATTARWAINFVVAMGLLTAVTAGAVALTLTRTLTQQIGTAVGHVQSASTELQAAANQQATGSKEQATSMAEITTTITELLATSRQIAESAQRVSRIAEETAAAARTGGATRDAGLQSVATIRGQVDAIVGHMLDLGRKSQQIGGVLEILAELSEQTNILAINATIEAAGAGEQGRRFGVVADEIRKLADRVGGSTKEVRVLIDDVRSAVNTTVMATESGSKAVDSGSRSFGDVAASFDRISSLVTTTTQAAREIELSTKQQSTAVEQVNLAIANAAQASRETEASAGQTLATASQLAHLSRDLLRVIRPQGANE